MLRLGKEADDHEEKDGHNVGIERGPVVDLEGGHERTHQHEEDGPGPQDRPHHQHELVADVREGDVVVDLDRVLVVHEEVHDVRHGGGDPAAPLVVELGEALRAVRVGVARGRVLHPVPALKQQGAQPTILSCTDNRPVVVNFTAEYFRGMLFDFFCPTISEVNGRITSNENQL